MASFGEACYAAFMMSYTTSSLLAMLVSVAPAPEASLVWTRPAPGESITIDAVPAGTDMATAQADVEATAALVDAIRTIRPHAIWRRISWRGGRMVVELVADNAIHANLATLALRRRFPGRSTAGTGIRQARRHRVGRRPLPDRGSGGPARIEGYDWDVRFLLARRPAPSRP